MSYAQPNDMSMADCLRQQVVAMAYVPTQKWKDVYEICHGFPRGTVFAELYKPWMVGGGK